MHLEDNTHKFDFKEFAENIEYDPACPKYRLVTRIPSAMEKEITHANAMKEKNLIVNYDDFYLNFVEKINLDC